MSYSLLLGFVAPASAALFIGAGQSASTIWDIANAEMSNAAVAASEKGGKMRQSSGGSVSAVPGTRPTKKLPLSGGESEQVV